MMAFVTSGHISAQEPSESGQSSNRKTETSVAAPDLSEIAPLAAELSGRLVILEAQVQSSLDLASLQRKYTGIEANLDGYVERLGQLQESGDFRASRLCFLREAIEDEKDRLEVISKSIKKEVSKCEARRREWLGEKKRWGQWQAHWSNENMPDQLRSTFAKVNETIEKGLAISRPCLEVMLAEQDRIGTIQEKLYVLSAKVNQQIDEKRFDAFLGTSPPMFSGRYISQFTGDLWQTSLDGIDEMVWSSIQYSHLLARMLSIQAVAFTFLIALIFRQRPTLSESARWGFIASRPFSACVFSICIITLIIYEYQEAQPVVRLINAIIGGIAFGRVAGGMTESKWKRQFVYGLMGLFIVTRIIQEFSFPLPILRLYTVLTGFVGLIFCWRWSRTGDCQKESPFYAGLMGLGVAFWAVVVLTQLWGQQGLSFYLFISMMRSVMAVITFVLLNRMIYGGVQWLFRFTLLQRAFMFITDDTNTFISGVARLLGIALAGLVLLPGILMIWGVFQNLNEATKKFWAFEFKVGSFQLSLAQVIIACAVIYGSFGISRILKKIGLDLVLRKGRIEKGVRLSIERLIHYVVLFIGFMLAASLLGFELTKFTIILSALGVGIGFGLQSVVNNFVSGLILLFERPIREGDTVEIAGQWAEVRKIGLRATTVQTYDQSDLIVPNADLTTQQVTNWTLSSRQVRLIVPVGVAYGSDVSLVFETLLACAKANSMVSERPEPQVLFLKFGESSLDFELRVWVNDASCRMIVKSALHKEIDRCFRQANIVIAFPQRDLHLRSVNESVNLPPGK